MNPFFKKIAKTAYKLGDHNDPLNVVLAIALFKGINRPLFTMMDKKSDKETKKYAAFREGLTEVIAATTYIATNRILVNPLTKILTKHTGGHVGRIKNALEFLCVCLSAAVLIPAACNLSLKPIMNLVQKLGKKKKVSSENSLTEIKADGKLNIKEPESEPLYTNLKTPTGPNSLLSVLQLKYPPTKGGLKI